MPEQLRFHDVLRPAVASPAGKAGVTAAAYVVLCSAYILFSGRAAQALAGSAPDLARIEMAKGIAFVAVTGGLFFGFAYARWRRIRLQEEEIVRRGQALLRAERMSAAGLTAAVLAHDLNNALTVQGAVVHALRRRTEDPELVALMADLDESGAALARLARRISGAARTLTEGAPEPVELREALERLLAQARRHPAASGRVLALRAGGPLEARLCRVLFEEAILNLLINAAQATSEGGRVEVRLTAQDGGAVIEVHDDGPGIDAAIADEIFAPCFTTKPEGTGLGLLSVRALADAASGSIGVGRSDLGGAAFRLTLRAGAPARDGCDA